MTPAKEMKYFFNEDVLYISLSDQKSSIGDEDYQENVVLYRYKKKVVGIEINNFTDFKETLIKISSSQTLNFAESFKRIKMVISLRDIIIDDPEQFEETMKIWGFKNIKKENLEAMKEINLTKEKASFAF